MTRILELKEKEQGFAMPIDLGLESTTAVLIGVASFMPCVFPYQIEKSNLNMESHTNTIDPYNRGLFRYGNNMAMITLGKGEIVKIVFNAQNGAYYHGTDFAYFHGKTATTRTKNLVPHASIDKTEIGLHPVMHRFNKFETLKAGWDTYGAQPIKKETINRAIEFFCSLLYANNYKALPIPFVVPCADGGITFEWKTCFKEFYHTIPADKKQAYPYYKINKLDARDEYEGETFDTREIIGLITNWLIKE